MSSTYDPLVGQVLDDRYEILAKVARGGMATVYRARDRRLTRIVAVKIMRSDLGEDDEFAAKFDREARAAATINHPAVVGVFDQGVSHGQPYIVMEYVDGETLRRLISREAPLPPREALELLEPVVSALACAHEHGLVHRDIKPENVLISVRGQVKVADFGLARLTTAPQMTATGVLVGTASYLPPELVTHSRPDSRSDVYSTGVVLFEMLTGKKPHTGENNYQIAYRHVNVDIEPPSERLAALGHRGWPIPDYVDALVLAATARNPDARLSDARVFLDRLREVRTRLAHDPASDDANLTSKLLPAYAPPDEKTIAISPTPPPRPRPYDWTARKQHAGEMSAPGPVTHATPTSHWDNSPQRDHASPWGNSSQRENSSPWENSPHWEDSPRWENSTHGNNSQRWETASYEPSVDDHASRPPESGYPTPQRRHKPALTISQKPVHKRRRGMLLLTLLVLLVVGAGMGTWWFTEGRFTTAPALANTQQADVAAAAQQADLKTTTVEEFSETVARSVVIRTDPPAGSRLLRGQTITVVVSKGPERFAMPKIQGLKKAEAEKALASVNLQLGAVKEEYSETVPAGVILTSAVEPGTQLKRDHAVDVVMSRGKQPIPVPNFTGKKTADAKQELEKAGFKVTIKQENSKKVARGLVISQSPTDGNKFKGDEISLVDSLGPVMVTVPDVRYQSTDKAVKELQKAGFKVEKKYLVDTSLALNIASGTDPRSGAKAPEGSTIVLLIA